MPITDFTYRSYEQLLCLVAGSGYIFSSYDTAETEGRTCILRHDVDFSLEIAAEFAKFESEIDAGQPVRSTYFVLLGTDFYNPFGKNGRKAIDTILSLGHEIGLHFDETLYAVSSSAELCAYIQEEADTLSKAIGKQVNTVSMHRPSRATLEADLEIEGLINSYSGRFFKEFKYLSDSRMHWREDAEEVVASGKHERLHLLTHPIWYAETEEGTREKLLRFIGQAGKDRYQSISICNMPSRRGLMKVAIHQPHFLPWMGYFDKMAKADVFILMDEVILEDCSPMIRNRMLDRGGNIQYLTAHVYKKGRLEKPCCEIEAAYEKRWNEKTLKFLEMNYKHSPFFHDVYPDIFNILIQKQRYLIEIQVPITKLMISWLQIETPILRQREMVYDKAVKKNELVLALTQAAGGDHYLSGRGAMKYMDNSIFERQGVRVEYQTFQQPEYKPLNASEFVPQLSILDMFFSCGIEETRRAFWENVNSQQAGVKQ